MARGYETVLVVADSKGAETVDGVSIIDVGLPVGRLYRIANTTRQIYKQALLLNADLFHLHDPELLPIGLRLKKLGYKVIFDSHEDVPAQLLNKDYLPPIVCGLIPKYYKLYESWACHKLDGVIAATPFIRAKFLSTGINAQDVANFPILDEFSPATDWESKKNEVCYVGSIGRVRGIEQMCDAMQHVETSSFLNLVGQFDDSELHETMRKKTGWQRVYELGLLSRSEVRCVLGRSVAGIVTLNPISNYLDALPIKMFEYMSAGIPVIASDFPLWRQIIEGNDCGVLVDPMKPMDIANAIDSLLLDRDLAKRLGSNGRSAVESKYNWTTQERKLFNFYESILCETPVVRGTL